MKRIIITGCAGFIGHKLVESLVKKNKIIGIDNLFSGKIKRNPIHKNFTFIKGSCEDKNVLNKVNGRVDYIYHLAGQSSGEKSFYDPIDDFKKNLFSTVSLLDFAIKKKCKRFIFASSMSVYGNKSRAKENDLCKPLSFYGLSKYCSEEYIKKYQSKNLNYTICRLFNVYGEGQSLDNYNQGMLRIYLTQIKKYGKLNIKGSKLRFRDFIDIKDVINIFVRLPYLKKSENQVLNIGTGRKTTVYELLNFLKKNINKPFKVKFSKGTPLDQFGIFANNLKIKKIFGGKINFKQKKNIQNYIAKLKI